MRAIRRRALLLGTTAAALALGLPDGQAASAPQFHSFLQPAEAAFVDAAVARLIPADESGPGAKEAGVTAYIDGQLAGPFGAAATWYMQPPFLDAGPDFDYQEPQTPAQLYRQAILAIDAYCAASHGKAFAALPPAAQDAVLTGLEEGHTTLPGVSGKAFFKLLLANTLEGYWADPVYRGNQGMAGWTLIGFPGARGDYRDDIEAWGKPYTLPPVDLMGQRA